MTRSQQPPSVVVAITGGRVVPIVGEPIEGGTVLIRDGLVEAVGAAADVEVPAGARVVDATGRWVLPGFVEAHGHVGISEEANGPVGNDTNEMTDPNTAGVRAIDAIAGKVDVQTVSIKGEEWQEVDFPEDLEKAQAITAGWAKAS